MSKVLPKYFKFLWSINFKSLQTHFNKPPTLPLYPTHKGFPQMMHQFCSKTTTMAMNDNSNDYNSSSLSLQKSDMLYEAPHHTPVPKPRIAQFSQWSTTTLKLLSKRDCCCQRDLLPLPLLLERDSFQREISHHCWLLLLLMLLCCQERERERSAAVQITALLSTKKKLLLLLSCQERVRLAQ